MNLSQARHAASCMLQRYSTRRTQRKLLHSSELAVQLISSYNYPSFEQRSAGVFNVKEDVHYFAQQLFDIGYLKTDADTYTSKYFVDVNVDGKK